MIQFFVFAIFIFFTHDTLTNNIPSHDKKLKEFASVAYSTMSTIYNTFFIAGECIRNNIPGDFVECGVAAGAQVATMAYACQKYNMSKKIHLFDSFEGIPLAGPNDTQQPGIGPISHNVNAKNLNDLLVSSGITVHSLEAVRNNMKRWDINLDNLVFHKGWFQFTLPVDALNISSISFLRLDGDLYESTKICLEYLYPKISKGGYIVIDDYALIGCKKAVDEYLHIHNLNPKILPVKGGLGPVYWQIQ